MFRIPSSFAHETEAYITIPPMKRFIKEHDLDTTLSIDRPEFISVIETFADASNENKETVFAWLDKVLKEGNKEVFIFLLSDNPIYINTIGNEALVSQVLEQAIRLPKHRHVVANEYSSFIHLLKYEFSNSTEGRVLSLSLCRQLSCCERHSEHRIVLYPVFIDIYLDRQIIIGRAKPKAGLYDYLDPFVFTDASSTNPGKQVKKAIEYISALLNVEFEYDVDAGLRFQQKLYSLLERFTVTPEVIREKISQQRDLIEGAISKIENDICELSDQYHEDISADVYNMVEKYLSISTADKSIFTVGRDAYPLKIKATDEEESRVEQTSANEEPLQSKAIFFDNKKMMQVSRCCDGVYFMFKRCDPRYFSKAHFQVNIFSTRSGCAMKFPQYTSEEDIIHAIFSLIGA